MKKIIESYIINLTRDDINNFSIKNNINLSTSELDFVYFFIKNNYEEILNNPNGFDFNKYKGNFSEESFNKINTLISKYISYL